MVIVDARDVEPFNHDCSTSEQILELAVQPDSWGERTKSCLISKSSPRLREIPAEDASVEEIAEISNIVRRAFSLN
jgi:hypothetical protein